MSFIVKPGTRIEGNEVDLLLDKCSSGDHEKNYVPAYNFSILLSNSETSIGHLNLRIGTNKSITNCVGHVGFGIDEEFRGNGCAAKASDLIKNLILQHKLEPVWITANPENQASIKTLLKIGAKYVETVEVPINHEIYQLGEPRKCRFIWNLIF